MTFSIPYFWGINFLSIILFDSIYRVKQTNLWITKVGHMDKTSEPVYRQLKPEKGTIEEPHDKRQRDPYLKVREECMCFI